MRTRAALGGLGGWWRLRSTREQRLLLVMGALLAITLIWFAIVRPLADALTDARARHTRAITAEAEARGQADAIAALARQRPARLTLPVRLFVPQAATAAGFTVERADAIEPDGVSIVIGSAKPAAFFTWLSGMQRRGLIVETLSATPSPDRTVAVQFTIRAQSR